MYMNVYTLLWLFGAGKGGGEGGHTEVSNYISEDVKLFFVISFQDNEEFVVQKQFWILPPLVFPTDHADPQITYVPPPPPPHTHSHTLQ